MPTITKNKVSDLETTRQKLAQTRDELKLKLHLAKADARDEWDELEKKWHHFERRAVGVQRESEATAKAVWGDLKEVVKDLQEGYARMRNSP